MIVRSFYQSIQYSEGRTVDPLLLCHRATGTDIDYNRVYGVRQTKALTMTTMIHRLWSVRNELVSKIAASENSRLNNERLPIDHMHSLNQPTDPLNEDILKFWELNGNTYTHLKEIVELYLGLTATSVPLERLLSLGVIGHDEN